MAPQGLRPTIPAPTVPKAIACEPPTGAGPSVAFYRDSSWDQHFTTPGDIDTAVSTYRGASLVVPELGTELHESGLVLPDDTVRGHFTSDDPEAIVQLCALLVG